MGVHQQLQAGPKAVGSANRTEVLQSKTETWLKSFISPQESAYLFVKGANKHIQCGYYTGSNVGQLVSDALAIGESAEGIYFAINSLSDSISDRNQNKLSRSNPKGLKDCDIKRRRLILIDVDPERESKTPYCSATDGEKQRARIVAKAIQPCFVCLSDPRPFTMNF